MSMLCLCVCLSVCLSVRQDICRTARAIFSKCFVHVACVRGSVLLRYVDDRPHRLSAGRGGKENEDRKRLYNTLSSGALNSSFLRRAKSI